MNFVLRTILAFALFQYGVFAQNCVGDMTVTTSEDHTITIYKWSDTSLSYEMYQNNVFGETKDSLIAANGILASAASELQSSPRRSADQTSLDQSEEDFGIRLNLIESETEAKATHLSVTFVPPTDFSSFPVVPPALLSLQEETILLDVVLTKGTWDDYFAGKTIEFELTPESSNLLIEKSSSIIFDTINSVATTAKGSMIISANNIESGISSFMANKELITHYTPNTSMDIEMKLCLN